MKISMLRFFALLFIAIAARQVFDISKAGWIGQPRVETKAPAQTNWLSITNSSLIAFDPWQPYLFYSPPIYSESRYSLTITEIAHGEGYFPPIVQLRTYAKTNKVESHESFEPNGVQWNLVLHPATTNLVTVHVLGYFSGTNAVELLEIEKPQAK